MKIDENSINSYIQFKLAFNLLTVLRLSRLVSIRYPEGILVLRLTIRKSEILAVIGVHTAAPRAKLLLSITVRGVIHAEPNAVPTVLLHVFSPLNGFTISGTGLRVS